MLTKERINMEKRINSFCDVLRDNYSIDPSLYRKYNTKRGLRNDDGTGVLVGLTNIGNVHGYIIDEEDKIPDEGCLRYRGINVSEIINNCKNENRFGFEEAAYLLLFGNLPDKKELEDFVILLGENRYLTDGFTEDMILKAPSKDIMNKLARAVLSSYSYDPDPDNLDLGNMLRQSIELIAKFPVMIAHAFQAKKHYYDKESLVIHSPRLELSTSENFLYMLRNDNKYSELEARILDTALILHAEHGGGNNSAFTTHVVSSSGTDTYSAIAAAVGSLKGPKHGGANNRVMGMMNEVMAEVENWDDCGEVHEYLVKILRKEAYDKSGLIYGMGHAVYTLSDPRAVILKEQAKQLAEVKGYINEYKLYDLVERLTPAAFKEVTGKEKILCANVDLYSGFVYKMLDIPKELYTPIFALSRIVGWCAHRMEEVITGGRIIRPAYKSLNRHREYINIEKR